MNENDVLITYHKRIDNNGKMIIPKFFILNNGRDYYMHVYKGKLVIEPIKTKKEGK